MFVKDVAEGVSDMCNLVKFVKYVRPDESEKHWNREELREIWINTESVSSVHKVISEYYGHKGFLESDIVTVLSMNDGQNIKVEGSMKEVIGKLKGR